MGLVLRLIVGSVLIVAATSQTCVHYREVLIRQCKIEHQVRLELVEELLQLFHIVGIDFCGLDVHLIAFGMDGIYQLVAFSLVMACNHKLSEDVLILDYLESGNRGNATGTNH